MNQETLNQIAGILGNGYKCFVDIKTEEVYEVEQFTSELKSSIEYKEYVPLEGPEFFKIMESYCSQVEDFDHQSQLMETLLYDQPFQSFKRKVYDLRIADDWIAYRTKSIADIIG